MKTRPLGGGDEPLTTNMKAAVEARRLGAGQATTSGVDEVAQRTAGEATHCGSGEVARRHATPGAWRRTTTAGPARSTATALAAARILAPRMAAVFLFALLLPCVAPLSSTVAADLDFCSGAQSQRGVTIAFVGDVIPHQRLLHSARDARTGGYDFTPIFQHIAPYLANADYAVANLETPLAGPGARFTGYPLFNAPLEFAAALRQAGVDLCSTANNHCLDRGWSGLVATLERLDWLGLAHTGTNRSLAERQTPLVVDIQGVRVAFLAYTETLNGHQPPVERRAYAVNHLDSDRVATDAALARLWGADIVIALFHWGQEYQRGPSVRQIATAEGPVRPVGAGQGEAGRETADYEGLLSRGVDVIIGHHPHVVQPIVRIDDPSGASETAATGKYVAYSLGNFLSNQPWRYADNGLIVYLHIDKNGFRVRVSGVTYLPVFVQRDASHYPTRYRLLPVLSGVEPQSDLSLTRAQRTRLSQIPEELEPLVFKPEQGIRPLDQQP